MPDSISQTFGSWLAAFVAAALRPQLDRIEASMSAFSDAVASLTATAADLKAVVAAVETKEVVSDADTAAITTAVTDLNAAVASLKTFSGQAPTPPPGA